MLSVFGVVGHTPHLRLAFLTNLSCSDFEFAEPRVKGVGSLKRGPQCNLRLGQFGKCWT